MPDKQRNLRAALLVSADANRRRACREIFEKLGFTVADVDSGVAAVVSARDRAPDVILVDEQLRDVPGDEAIGWLRSNPVLASTPIISSSAGLARNKADVIICPFTLQMIQQTVNQLLH
jgi:CheY-like chemotaxis protein